MQGNKKPVLLTGHFCLKGGYEMKRLSEDGSKMIGVRLPRALIEKLEKLGEQYGLNMSAIIRIGLTSFVEKNPLSK